MSSSSSVSRRASRESRQATVADWSRTDVDEDVEEDEDVEYLVRRSRLEQAVHNSSYGYWLSRSGVHRIQLLSTGR